MRLLSLPLSSMLLAACAAPVDSDPPVDVEPPVDDGGMCEAEAEDVGEACDACGAGGAVSAGGVLMGCAPAALAACGAFGTAIDSCITLCMVSR